MVFKALIARRELLQRSLPVMRPTVSWQSL
jgi:hypothetical protein